MHETNTLACEAPANFNELVSPAPHRSYREAGSCGAPDSFFCLLLFFRAGPEEEEGGEAGLLTVLGTKGENPMAEGKPEELAKLSSEPRPAEETRGILPLVEAPLTGGR